LDYFRFQGLIGVGVLLGLAWVISEHRRRIDWRLIGGGLLLQAVLAVLLLKVPGPATAVEWLSYGVAGVIARADAGIAFVFSPQLIETGAPWGFIFAVRVLPVIIFFASLMSVLYYLGLMQRVVAGLAWVLRRTLGVTGAEALAMASNVFVGQTEAPLCVRPLLEKMTRAQLMTLMVGGFATIAGSVLAAYVAYLAPDAAVGASAEEVKAALDMKAMWIKHLITASVMSAPAAFVMARVIVPETEEPPAEHVEAFKSEDPPANLFDAAAIGATDGLKLALNVAGMLIAFVSLVALVSWPLEALGAWGPVHKWLAGQGIETLNLEVVFGWVFAPLAWTMGVPWEECAFFGTLMGEKVVVTEFVAYTDLALDVNSATPVLSERSAILAAYALCGFANFASIGIQIGGLSALAPGRRKQFVQLALKAMIGGALASWMTASLVGVLL
jgi:concentrative nucleoside transporter, CNT family